MMLPICQRFGEEWLRPPGHQKIRKRYFSGTVALNGCGRNDGVDREDERHAIFQRVVLLFARVRMFLVSGKIVLSQCSSPNSSQLRSQPRSYKEARFRRTGLLP